jgi:hypothetical protein
MRIEPVIKVKVYPFKNLTKAQNTARLAAIALAFVGVFVWMFKILF